VLAQGGQHRRPAGAHELRPFAGVGELDAGLSAWLGWRWSDLAAALIIAALAIEEGLGRWQQDGGA
jgi:hypothetical protein